MYKLYSKLQRQQAIQAVSQAPDDFVVIVRQRTRSLEQNAKFHALCSDVAKQATWLGKNLRPEQWKVLFISGHDIALGIKAKVVSGLEGEYVNIRESSARMSVDRMSSLIEYLLAWCSENDVICHFDEVNYANKNERRFDG